MATYLRPQALGEALEALRTAPRTIVAGATDHYPSRVGASGSEDILDISAVEGLSGIAASAQGWRIGALATWSDVIAADLPPLFDGLKATGHTIGGVQIQNRGTVCGNVCNASPAADGIPSLMALDAEIELASTAGTRRMEIAEFVTGNRKTERRPEELVSALVVPSRGSGSRSTFTKLGSRSSLIISIAMVAAAIDMEDDGRIAHAAIAVGACSPVALRLVSVESRLLGRRRGADLASEITAADLSQLHPIDDIRGSAVYRRQAALVLVKRVVEELTT